MQSNTYAARFIAAVFIFIVGLGVGAFVGSVLNRQAEAVATSYPADSYQAVFLSNNQVYFGKLTNMGSQYPRLSNVYYIQAFAAQDLTGVANSAKQLQLVKLGSEIHQPQNSMDINRDQILFVETLKPDSQIVKSIENFQKNQTQ